MKLYVELLASEEYLYMECLECSARPGIQPLHNSFLPLTNVIQQQVMSAATVGHARNSREQETALETRRSQFFVHFTSPASASNEVSSDEFGIVLSCKGSKSSVPWMKHQCGGQCPGVLSNAYKGSMVPKVVLLPLGE